VSRGSAGAGMRQAKQPVSAALAGPYGHPLHPLLVTVPIGAWLTSLVFDVASRFAAHPGFLTQGAEWLIGIGVAGALAAATVGFLDLLGIAPGTPAFRTAIWHMSLNLVITGTYAANRSGWYGCRHKASAAGPCGLSRRRTAATVSMRPGICRPGICRSGLCRSRIRRSRIWISSGSAHGGPQRRLRCCSRRCGGGSLRLLRRRVQQRLPLQLLWRLGLPGSVWILNGLSACGRRSGPEACRCPPRRPAIVASPIAGVRSF